MLVLGRKPGEYVVIGEDVFVKVVRSEQGDLRLAIEAPKHVKITRGEIYEREQAAKNVAPLDKAPQKLKPRHVVPPIEGDLKEPV